MRSIPGLGWLIAVIIITAVIASSLVLLPITNGNTRIDTQPASAWINDDSGIRYIDVAGARCFTFYGKDMQCISLKDL